MAKTTPQSPREGFRGYILEFDHGLHDEACDTATIGRWVAFLFDNKEIPDILFTFQIEQWSLRQTAFLGSRGFYYPFFFLENIPMYFTGAGFLGWMAFFFLLLLCLPLTFHFIHHLC